MSSVPGLKSILPKVSGRPFSAEYILRIDRPPHCGQSAEKPAVAARRTREIAISGLAAGDLHFREMKIEGRSNFGLPAGLWAFAATKRPPGHSNVCEMKIGALFLIWLHTDVVDIDSHILGRKAEQPWGSIFM